MIKIYEGVSNEEDMVCVEKYVLCGENNWRNLDNMSIIYNKEIEKGDERRIVYE
ncbi:MAG: hypothetical protein ACMUIP_12475 [bacterium]